MNRLHSPCRLYIMAVINVPEKALGKSADEKLSKTSRWAATEVVTRDVMEKGKIKERYGTVRGELK